MAKVMLDKHWAAIDIGTTKICVLIAGLDATGAIQILGMGQHPSYGLKKGVVVDINTTIESIKAALVSAQSMAGVTVTRAAIGISGGHIQSYNSHGVVAVRRKDVTQEDIDRVIDAAKAISIPADREVLHVLPQYFKVDGQELIKDSRGMSGVRLEAQVHIITGSIASANNLIKCCESAGVVVTDIILEQLASAEAVLTDSEKEMGVGILDIGGGTSDFALFKDGRIRHSKVIPVAGNHFTNDLAIGLRVTAADAEILKRNFGFVFEEKYLDIEHDAITIDNGCGGRRSIDTYELYEVLNPRARELFSLVMDEIIDNNLIRLMPFGLVITGGGSLITGMAELAAATFDMPVRIGMPHDTLSIGRNGAIPDMLRSPIYATAYGLLLYTAKEHDLTLAKTVHEPPLAKIFKRMKSWICDFV